MFCRHNTLASSDQAGCGWDEWDDDDWKLLANAVLIVEIAITPGVKECSGFAPGGVSPQQLPMWLYSLVPSTGHATHIPGVLFLCDLVVNPAGHGFYKYFLQSMCAKIMERSSQLPGIDKIWMAIEEDNVDGAHLLDLGFRPCGASVN